MATSRLYTPKRSRSATLLALASLTPPSPILTPGQLRNPPTELFGHIPILFEHDIGDSWSITSDSPTKFRNKNLDRSSIGTFGIDDHRWFEGSSGPDVTEVINHRFPKSSFCFTSTRHAQQDSTTAQDSRGDNKMMYSDFGQPAPSTTDSMMAICHPKQSISYTGGLVLSGGDDCQILECIPSSQTFLTLSPPPSASSHPLEELGNAALNTQQNDYSGEKNIHKTSSLRVRHRRQTHSRNYSQPTASENCHLNPLTPRIHSVMKTTRSAPSTPPSAPFLNHSRHRGGSTATNHSTQSGHSAHSTQSCQSENSCYSARSNPSSTASASSTLSSKFASLPTSLHWLKHTIVSLLIDQEGFRAVSPAFKLVRYSCPCPSHDEKPLSDEEKENRLTAEGTAEYRLSTKIRHATTSVAKHTLA